MITNSELIAFCSLLVCIATTLPGSLGLLKYSHRFAATRDGARWIFVTSIPMYTISAIGLSATIAMTMKNGERLGPIALVTLLFIVCSVYAFLMHTGLVFKPIKRPTYVSLEEAIDRYGKKEEIIGVIDRQGQAFAYITQLARRPHVVYQNEGPSPFIMSHCILAHSSMAYEIDDCFKSPKVCISSVLANNLVFYDKKNHNTVQQVLNKKVEMEEPLTPLPTIMTSLACWKEQFPNSKVWVREIVWRDTFYFTFLARKSVIDPSSPELVYPLQHPLDIRLPMKSAVLGIHLGSISKAYPEDLFKRNRLIQDTLGKIPICMMASPDGEYIQVFSRENSDRKTLSFLLSEKHAFIDDETGSTWNLKGECTLGHYKGHVLQPIPHYSKIFWFCWADFYPETEIYDIHQDSISETTNPTLHPKQSNSSLPTR